MVEDPDMLSFVCTYYKNSKVSVFGAVVAIKLCEKTRQVKNYLEELTKK